MAIHEEAVHVKNADVPDERAGGALRCRFFVRSLYFYGLRGVHLKGAKLPLVRKPSFDAQQPSDGWKGPFDQR